MIYLYLKTHLDTGLCYFGKTTRDPYKYYGSGKKWLRHISKHGRSRIHTEILLASSAESEVIDYALKFSEEKRIVESAWFANIIPENGLDGKPPKLKSSEKTIKKMKESLIGNNKGNTYGARSFEVITPKGISHIVTNLKEWCENNGLTYTCALKCVQRGNKHKGYQFIRLL